MVSKMRELFGLCKYIWNFIHIYLKMWCVLSIHHKLGRIPLLKNGFMDKTQEKGVKMWIIFTPLPFLWMCQWTWLCIILISVNVYLVHYWQQTQLWGKNSSLLQTWDQSLACPTLTSGLPLHLPDLEIRGVSDEELDEDYRSVGGFLFNHLKRCWDGVIVA